MDTLDALACEPQFLDHLAPLWRALPADARGIFYAPERLLPRAAARGVYAVPIDDMALRARSFPPRAVVEDGPRVLVASIGDTKIGRRIGYRRFAFLEHGAGQAYHGDPKTRGHEHPSYAGGADREDTELFLVPNVYSAALWRTAYPSARVEIVGSPRLDDLPGRHGSPGKVVAISFHWDAHLSPEAGSAVGHYLPHLGALRKAYPDIIGHAHPKGDWPERMERMYARHGIPFEPEFDEVCKRADVYVVDNSSTLFEFASTGRPVVVLNAPWYRRNISHGLRFWDAAHVGVNVDQPAQLVAGVAEALEDLPGAVAAREAALSIVYPVRRGGARRAAQAVLAWMAADSAEVA